MNISVCRRLWQLVTAVLIVSSVAGAPAYAETLIIQGSTTFARRLMEPYQSAIEAQSKQELKVIPNKSLPGLIGLLEGRAQMSMISSSLSSEIAALEKTATTLPYKKLKAHEIVVTRISVGVHSSNPVRKASRDQIKKIVLGEIKNWSELSGPDLPIRVVMVGGGGGVTTVVEAELLGGQSVKGPHIIYVKTPVQLVQVVEQERGAVGFAQLALVKERNLPEMTVDEPIEQTLSYVTVGDPTPAMRAVIDATRRIAAEKAVSIR